LRRPAFVPARFQPLKKQTAGRKEKGLMDDRIDGLMKGSVSTNPLILYSARSTLFVLLSWPGV
jgi:hypothetical protein